MFEFILGTIVVILSFYNGITEGSLSENKRLYDKCVIEFQDKSHKDVIEICKERVK